GVAYGKALDTDMALRVIADHARCSAFLIADGVLPGNTEREYTLLRIFRRAVRHGQQHLGIKKPFMHRVCERVIALMGDAYPELRERRATIEKATLNEETKFRETLQRGLAKLDSELAALGGEKVLPGKVVFTLYDTYGFPDDLTEIIAQERGYAIDRPGFKEELTAAKARSAFKLDDPAVETVFKQLASELGPTKFTGYEGRGTSGT